MPFWKGETLLARLPALIPAFDPKQIDCAAYTLTLGDQAFVTSDLPEVGGAKEGVKEFLTSGEQVRIAPGQFAFLLTQESVEVPNNAIAFISMKATYKFRGLINVSGFHVDPGWNGKLIFGVYNAGPSSVVLERGMPLFLIWYADLDGVSQKVRPKGNPRDSISPDLVSNMSGQVFSPIALNKQIQRLGDKISTTKDGLVELKAFVDTFYKAACWAAVAAVSIVASGWFYLHQKHGELEKEITSRQPIIAKPTSTPAKSGAPIQQAPQALGETGEKSVSVKPSK